MRKMKTLLGALLMLLGFVVASHAAAYSNGDFAAMEKGNGHGNGSDPTY